MKSTFTNSTRIFTIFLLSFLCSPTVILAQIGPGIAPVNSLSGGFNIDGTLIANTAAGDWTDGTGTGGFVLANSGVPLNSGTTYHLYDPYNNSTDNIFGGGDKVSDNPNSMTWVPGTANNKTDMNNALIHLTTDSNGNVWVIFAADRLSNSGNAYVDFEFLQSTMTKTSSGFTTTAPASTGGRTAGDFLLTVYFESGVAKFDIQRWELNGSVWEYKTYFSSLPANSVFADGNSTTVPVPFQAFGVNNYLQNTFIESAVNLTEVLGAIDPCISLKIKTIFVKSKTSTSPSAAIKDFFDPLQINNLTLGSADAGDDDTVCAGSPYTLQGAAIPSNGYEVISKTWSVVGGSATIVDPTDLHSNINITSSPATLRLTVVTGPLVGSGSQCTVSDDVIITVNQPLTCSISGSSGPLCPSSSSNIYSAPSSATYLWKISGNGSIVGNSNSQTVSVTTGIGCNTSFTLTSTITNSNGCTSTCTKTVSVVDDSIPIVTTAANSLDHTLQCNNTVGIAAAIAEVPTATDNCTANPTLNLVSDTNTANANCANAYVRTRTWNFSDGCGNTSANFVQTITVIDNTAPVITTTSNSLDHTLQCNNIAAIAAALAEVPAATDNCTANPTMNLVSDTNTPNANCTNAYVRVRTWNFSDGCGNTSANFVQTITVIDNTAPVVSTASNSLDHTLQCNNTAAIAAALAEVPAATDNCSANPTMNLVSDTNTANANCANAYVRVRTWNFSDGCGNTSANFVQTITVIDNTAPVVSTTANSLNHTLQCNNTAAIAAALAEVPAATDNCTANPTMNLVSDTNTANANCANAYVRTRTWNFSDGCGNTSANFVQTITVIDNTAPAVSTTADSLNHTLQCNNTAAIAAALAEVPTATDNCTANPTINLVSDTNTPNANCTNAYVRVRTWNFSDGCGNTSANFVQTITVIDNTAPVITTTAGSLNHTLQCNNTVSIAAALAEVPAATDNCTANPTMNLVSDTNTANANCANAYVRTRTWNFSDGCGNTSANFVQTITVIDNTAPVVSTAVGSLDHTLQCNNTAGIAAALAEVPTATDNCTANPTMNLVSDTNTPNANCTNAFVRVRTWNFSDGCGNTSANFVQTITVIDNTAPVITTTANSLDHTLQCNNTAAIAAALAEVPAATDNCTANPTMNLVSDTNTPNANCTNAYVRVRTWNFSDGCGNISANFVQTITVIDNTVPVITSTENSLDHTLQCNNTAGIAAALAEVPTATDNCTVNPTMNLVSDANTANANCANAYVRTRTWNFSDGCGNTSANFVQTITVIDNTPPTFNESLPADLTVECNSVPTAKILTANDNCGMANVDFSETETAGTCAGSSTILRTWIATDACKNTTTFTQTIKVQDTTPPTFTPPTNKTLTSDENCFADISTTSTGTVTNIQDNCDPNPTATFVDHDCFGNSDITSVNAGSGNYFPFTVSGFDDITASNIEKIALAFETNQGKGRVEFTLVSPSGQGIVLVAPYCSGGNCDTATPSDPELYLPVFYPNSSSYPKWDNNNPVLPNVIQNFTPYGAVSSTSSIIGLNSYVSSFEELTGNMNGNWFIYAQKDGTELGTIEFKSVCLTPAGLCKNNKVIVRHWSVSDACKNTVGFDQVIKIVDTTAPTWTTEATALNSTIECSNTEDLAAAQLVFPIAKDNCDLDVSNITKVTGQFVASEGCANAGTYTNTWTVKDDCGNTSEVFTQVITIEDTTAPTWTSQASSLNKTIECSDVEALATAQGLIPLATDKCDEDVTNSIKVTGQFVASQGCANAGTYTNTWTVKDDCGNTSEIFTQIITIEDNTPPDINIPATNITVECDGQGNQNSLTNWLTNNGGATASDNCSDVTWTNNFNAISNDCSAAVTVVFTAKDACGNSSSTSATFSIKDNTNPIASENLATITVSCATDVPATTSLTATDNCSGEITTQGIDVITQGDCVNSFVITRTWTFTDACSNSSITTQTINVIDTLAPIIAPLPEISTISCPATPNFATATATDNCGASVSLTSEDVTTNGQCAGSYSVTRTWTATDACGNSSIASQTINVQDTTAPIIAALPEASTIACPATPVFAQASATDECSSTFTLTSEDVTTNGQCAGSYSVTRTWTATDACGNSSIASQTINVQDTNAPIIAELPEASTISCPATPEFAVASATDECGSTFTLTSEDVTTNGACAGSYSVTRTWTATDACGNSSIASQTINVQDTTAPIIAALPEASTIACPATPEFAVASATDECGSTFTLTSEDVTTNGQCAGSYSVTRTWTATDACGNSSIASQTINVQDKTAPIIAALPETSTVSCSTTPTFAIATATDECGSVVTLTSEDVTTNGACAGSYSVTRTWTATDACANSTKASQTINVQDTTAPTTTTDFAATIDVNCDAIPLKPELVFVDNCSTVSPAIFTEKIINRTQDSYSIVRKWSVADSCENTSVFTQIINVNITNSVIEKVGSVCNDGEITTIDLSSLLPSETPTGTWINVNNIESFQGSILNAAGLAIGNYVFEYKIDDATCPRTIRITITVTTGCGSIVLPCGLVVVHNAFSPNGDGINEVFVIDNIDDTNCYPDNTVEIYNRWGVLVFDTQGYNNTTKAFKGFSEGRSTISQSSGLPSGTYFYILNYTSTDGNGKIQTNKKDGYLYLTK
ncbi:gliding motility-associated C-terminal domain-containing protein [Flavobacterium sp. 83]|uniref:gliding motility-associated C-terminal domain-containing protein n=1 Tax=Flavobacterium sp. 83 TaxID=1131812 RepID=UPI00054EDD15|nr:gliding motility-associated C-terminal domain-containing protein [Flavobacterium sp. 83]